MSFWLVYEFSPDSAERPAAPGVPDYYLEGMERTVLDESGAIDYILRADRLSHFAADDSSVIEDPEIVIFVASDAPPWHATAERGLFFGGGEEVMLYDNVHLWRLDAAAARQWDVRTSVLRVLTKEQFADTDAPATILSRRGETRGIGLEADLKTDNLKLLDAVTGRYETAPR